MIKNLKVGLIAGTVLILFTISGHAAYGQTNEGLQLSKNVASPTPARHEDGGTNASSDLLQARIKAQQLEIDELQERVKRLESMLETIVANQPIRSTVPSESVRTQAANAAANHSPMVAAAIPAEVTPAKASAEPSASNPSSVRASGADVTPRELLPDIGQIGAQIGLLVGGAQNPFRANNGMFAGGYIDLPMKKVPGGKLSYEIMVGLQRTNTEVQTTSSVIALVNSALNNALGTPPGVNNLFSPLPVTNKARERMTVLSVVPVAFKYTMTSFDRSRFRPYGVIGLGAYVSLSTQTLTDFNANRYVSSSAVANLLNTLLADRQVAGLVPAAPELRERGVGQGQGDARFGINFGGGIEFRMSPRMSFGVDYRANKIEGHNGGPFQTFSFKQGFHF